MAISFGWKVQRIRYQLMRERKRYFIIVGIPETRSGAILDMLMPTSDDPSTELPLLLLPSPISISHSCSTFTSESNCRLDFSLLELNYRRHSWKAISWYWDLSQ